MKAFEII